MRVMRWLLRLCLSLFILMMLILTILMSPIGLRLSLFALKSTLPGQLTYKKVHGMLVGPIEIKQLNYTHAGRLIKIGELRFNWQPLQLIDKRVKISQLTAKKVTIITPEKKTSTEKSKTPLTRKMLIERFNALKPIEPKALHLPFGLIINNATLSQFTFGHDSHNPLIKAHKIFLSTAITEDEIMLDGHMMISKPFPMNVQLDASGNLRAYKFSSSIKSPRGDVTLKGMGNRHGAIIDIPTAHMLDGSLSAKIITHWFPKIQWEMNAKVSHLNLKPINDKLTKSLSGTLKTHGKLNQKIPFFNLAITGKSASTHLALTLAHHQQWKAHWTVTIPTLKTLYANSSGSLSTTGTMHGKLLSPQTTGNINAKDLEFKQLSLKHIQGKWNINVDTQKPSFINLILSKLHYNALNFDTIRVDLSGQHQHHTLKITTKAKNDTMHFALRGTYDGKQWSGKIIRFDSSAGLFGTWKLKSPTAFFVSDETRYLKHLCLIGKRSAHLCAEGEWIQGKPWKISINSRNINFSNVEKHLRLGTELTSTLSFNANVEGQAKQLTHAAIKLHLSAGELNYNYAGRRVSTKIRQSHAFLTIDPTTGLQTDIKLGFSAKDKLTTIINMPGFNKAKIPFSKKPINGTLNINAHDFRFVSLFEQDLRIGLGHLSGSLNLSGNINKPQLHGELKLEVPNFTYRSLRAHAKNIRATIKATGQRLDYDLMAEGYNGGPISLQGFSDMAHGFDTQFTLKTDNTQIIKTPNYDVYATASLYFLFAHDDFKLTGQVFVPQALIKPVDFSNTTTMPENIVTYIGLPKAKQHKRNNRQTNININVKLGNNVVLDAYGINAHLEGGVRILMSHNTTAMGDGQIRITEGTFKAYGQSLNMAQGSSISYVQSPLNNPSIDARAFKKINANQMGIGNQLGRKQITVGVHIQGTINKMRFNLYSQPGNLSQADILSYLVLGYASNNASGANLSLLLDAANSLSDSSNGLTSPLNLTNSIKKKLGIQTFGVRNETQLDAIGNSVNTQSAFVVGDRISKRIYIEFSHGLLIPDNVFRLQYKLTDNWMLQFSTGSGDNVGTGADILYSISRD